MLAEEGAALEEAEPLGGLALACYPETDQQMAGALRESQGERAGQGRSGQCRLLGTRTIGRSSFTRLGARNPRPRCRQAGFILKPLLLAYRGP